MRVYLRQMRCVRLRRLTEFVTLNRALPRLRRCVMRSRRAALLEQAGAARADGRGRVCLPAPPGHPA